MKVLLTDEELDQECINIVTFATLQPRELYKILQFQYQTGPRGEELCFNDTIIFEDGTNNISYLSPKTGVVRSFDNIYFEFMAWEEMKLIPMQYDIYSKSALRRYFVSMLQGVRYSTAAKYVNLHLFRYNLAKKLRRDGMDIESIKIYMGLLSTEVAAGYVEASIYKEI